ncbi:SlyX family protein [Limnobacter alexandrii]|jgi:predicted  nucleic acid-binding Zn-ribbon protein|uniref:SlyX family protein n=1 Tax=Limnobacter alexandrii TaxID=2570352 RepID=UPI001107D667|nr:SlyX family protein [Limnobacter alexandrii]
MPAGWVTVLQMVPWGEVIKNAPKVADGAVKLWSSVSKKKVYDETGSEISDVILASDPEAVEKLEYRLQAAEQTITDLQAQVVQSAEVIKELASQNTQLVAQIESNRKAVTVLGVALAIALVAGVVQAVVLFGA